MSGNSENNNFEDQVTNDATVLQHPTDVDGGVAQTIPPMTNYAPMSNYVPQGGYPQSGYPHQQGYEQDGYNQEGYPVAAAAADPYNNYGQDNQYNTGYGQEYGQGYGQQPPSSIASGRKTISYAKSGPKTNSGGGIQGRKVHFSKVNIDKITLGKDFKKYGEGATEVKTCSIGYNDPRGYGKLHICTDKIKLESNFAMASSNSPYFPDYQKNGKCPPIRITITEEIAPGFKEFVDKVDEKVKQLAFATPEGKAFKTKYDNYMKDPIKFPNGIKWSNIIPEPGSREDGSLYSPSFKTEVIAKYNPDAPKPTIDTSENAGKVIFLDLETKFFCCKDDNIDISQPNNYPEYDQVSTNEEVASFFRQNDEVYLVLELASVRLLKSTLSIKLRIAEVYHHPYESKLLTN